MRKISTPPTHPRPGLLFALIALVASTACSTASAGASEADRIVEVLALRPGQSVADVGAGEGEWTEPLAAAVGSTGRVWATEVVEEELVKLRQRVEDFDLANVTVVSGDQENTGLPEACCDAVLLRMVYHHFEDPAAMRASLHRALRPGGRIAVIDIKPQKNWRHLEGVPERGGHGIEPDDLVAELTSAGFEELARYERWNDDEDRYCIVFKR